MSSVNCIHLILNAVSLREYIQCIELISGEFRQFSIGNNFIGIQDWQKRWQITHRMNIVTR